MCTVLLTSVQEDYANDLGVELGGEFRCAHQYWLGKPNCHLILGDRPLSLTLVRAWESLSLFGRIKVMLGLLWSSFRKPDPEELREWLRSVLRDETDVLTESFLELRRHFPTLYTTIIEERDAWLAAKLVQTVRALQHTRRESTVVAIVGAGHMPGILQWLTAPPNASTPEEILRPLTVTRKWANDEVVQKTVAPAWIHEVTELNQET
jgi:pheromone shutdown protein TraB